MNEAAAERTGKLPAGVLLRPLVPYRDHRGSFTELFRESWDMDVRPIQWNAADSLPNVLRGVHVHFRHDDYLVVLRGRASIGLMDLRDESSTRDLGAVVELDGERPAALKIPTGVAHGFYFHTESTHLYGVTRYWDPRDELSCRWDDPELTIPWTPHHPTLSERDARAQSLAALRAELRAVRRREAPRRARG